MKNFRAGGFACRTPEIQVDVSMISSYLISLTSTGIGSY